MSQCTQLPYFNLNNKVQSHPLKRLAGEQGYLSSAHTKVRPKNRLCMSRVAYWQNDLPSKSTTFHWEF